MDESRLIIESTRGLLAHRDPFLFVDWSEIGADESSAWGRRRFSADEPFFRGHFPGNPIVPGVIILELAAQTANLLLSYRARRQVDGYLVGVEEARFNLAVRPNQTAAVHIRLARQLPLSGEIEVGRIIGFKAAAYVENQRCMRAVVSLYVAGFNTDHHPFEDCETPSFPTVRRPT
jgi:3-hydroxyacyl-[acyl-carrier-protein] dehydratase